jgi:hypothetical protein
MRHTHGMLCAALLLFLVTCKRAGTTTTDAAPTAALGSTAWASAPASISKPPALRRLTPREAVEAWNKAHIAHDLNALASIYAPHVEFYGQTVTNKQCVAAKKAAFAKSPDYTQSIGDIDVHDDGVVTFTKTSRSGGKSTDYPAVLVVTGGLVTAETDKVTEANLAAQAAKNATWCVDHESQVISPFRISVAQARERVETAGLSDMCMTCQNVVGSPVTCPTKCERATHECGYELPITAYPHMKNANGSYGYDPDCQCVNFDYSRGTTVGWVYVDAIDGTLYDQDEQGNWQKREPPTHP